MTSDEKTTTPDEAQKTTVERDSDDDFPTGMLASPHRIRL
jgi:hypothetical protein